MTFLKLPLFQKSEHCATEIHSNKWCKKYNLRCVYVSNQGGLWPIEPFFNVKSLKKYYSIVVVDEIDEAKNLSLSWEKRGEKTLSCFFSRFYGWSTGNEQHRKLTHFFIPPYTHILW